MKKIIIAIFIVFSYWAKAQLSIGDTWYYQLKWKDGINMNISIVKDSIVDNQKVFIVKNRDGIEYSNIIPTFYLKNDGNLILYKFPNDTSWYFFGYNKMDTLEHIVNIRRRNYKFDFDTTTTVQCYEPLNSTFSGINSNYKVLWVVGGFPNSFYNRFIILEGFGSIITVFPRVTDKTSDGDPYTNNMIAFRKVNCKCIVEANSNFICPPLKNNYFSNIENSNFSMKKDSILYNLTVTTANLSSLKSRDYKISNDTIYIESCYSQTSLTQPSIHEISVNLGVLSSKIYTINNKVNVSFSDGQNCEPEFYDQIYKTLNLSLTSNSSFRINKTIIYPNPAQSTLFIKEKLSDRATFTIYNSLGAAVQIGNIPTDNQIDISSLQSGIYQITLQTIDKSFIARFAKE